MRFSIGSSILISAKYFSFMMDFKSLRHGFSMRINRLLIEFKYGWVTDDHLFYTNDDGMRGVMEFPYREGTLQLWWKKLS